MMYLPIDAEEQIEKIWNERKNIICSHDEEYSEEYSIEYIQYIMERD